MANNFAGNLAIIGCGYAADFYGTNLPNHPKVRLAGVFDINSERSRAFTEAFGGGIYQSLEDLLNDPQVQVVANLTPIQNHAELGLRVLHARKHLYSEKPLALGIDQIADMHRAASSRRVGIGLAPCIRFGEAYRTLLLMERSGALGRSVYAECVIHEGFVHKKDHHKWISKTGAVWPYVEEFSNGCILEHVGYALDILVDLWGPAITLSAEGRVMVPSKRGVASGPDWGRATLTFGNGAVAHVTVSTVAPEDRHLTVICEEGVITIKDIWRGDSAVHIQRGQEPTSDGPHLYLKPSESLSLIPSQRLYRYQDSHDIDQVAGIAELLDAVEDNFRIREITRRSLHLAKLTHRINANISCGVVNVDSDLV